MSLATRILARLPPRSLGLEPPRPRRPKGREVIFDVFEDGFGVGKGRDRFGIEKSDDDYDGYDALGIFGGDDLEKLADQAGLGGLLTQARQVSASARTVPKTVSDVDREALMLQRPTRQLSELMQWWQDHHREVIAVGVVLGGIFLISTISSSLMLAKLAKVAHVAAVAA